MKPPTSHLIFVMGRGCWGEGGRLLTNQPRDRPVGGLHCYPGDQEKTPGTEGREERRGKGTEPT